jgi:hypothetical protein
MITKLDTWLKKFELLKKFYTEFNRVPKNKEVYQEVQLGQWLANHKKKLKKGSIDPFHKEQLDLLLKDWVPPNEHRIIQDEYFKALKEFYILNNRWPEVDESHNQMKIGKWCRNHRCNFKSKKISSTLIETLNSIGFDWSLPNRKKSTRGTDWEKYFEEVVAFKNINNRLPKDSESSNDFNLGNWIYRQKVIFKKGILDESYALRLKSIGIDLTIKTTISKNRSKKKNWYQYYQEMVSFLVEHQRLPKSVDKISGDHFMSFIYKCRQDYRLNSLSSNKLDLLNQINFIFLNPPKKVKGLEKINELNKGKELLSFEEVKRVLQIKKTYKLLNSDFPVSLINALKNSTWNINFSITKEFINTHGYIPKFKDHISVNGISVSKWIHIQLIKADKGQLTDFQIKKLNEISLLKKS